jgi:hypothetical protein
LLPSGVQAAHQLRQVLGDGHVQAQGRQDILLDRVPVRALQEAGARVGPAVRGRGEHVAVVQGPVQLLQHAHDVGVPVHRALRQVGVGVHRLAPCRRHELVVHLARQQRLHPDLPPRQRRKTPHPGQDPLARARRVERLRLAQQREERADRGVPGRQRGPHRDVGRVLVLGYQGHHGGPVLRAG